MSAMEPLDEQGSALFDAMVRWRALSTTAILMGFVAGLAQLIVTSTGGGPVLSKSLAGVAIDDCCRRYCHVCCMGSST